MYIRLNKVFCVIEEENTEKKTATTFAIIYYKVGVSICIEEFAH